jgi:hypothetical protein
MEHIEGERLVKAKAVEIEGLTSVEESVDVDILVAVRTHLLSQP